VVTEKILVKEGEAGRHQRVVIPTAPEAKPAPAPAVLPVPPSTPRSRSPLPTTYATSSAHGPDGTRALAWALGGVGVAGLVVGTAFGVGATVAWSQAKSACGGDTSQCADVARGTQYRATTETDGTVATVGFVAGGALLAAAAALVLFGHHGEAAAARVVPVLGPGQVGLAGGGAF